ncbi:bifunctional adenosylcobinamide kinase/adenosylcobinamide-phosphate guanylyltransferase [Nocardioides immobilis]|uniref:Adenosylcobinamide kinase n=1 Tax=Nocardioides immobilis TaxID=2049295 RepID=A0A417XWM0_9ACTN|nr:bifunctional adenosylcobinamide kinase/adenosylcobinamide-phosphate guanylyltransferase [Nocardioides immobilis]RHW24660.1 bifunctional adenosylcobinamide kinase/adenosylcobinamide-phosphate guanylyltransferase [Nocardioides immobilis]
MAERPGLVLVTGGVRSGKSAHAESLLASEPTTTYIAAGPTYDDADWRARIARHRERRPATWATIETTDLAVALAEATGPVLVDCLGTWLDATIGGAGLWEAPVDEVEGYVATRTTGVTAALRAATSPVVVVTNEVGLGVVPEHRSGRIFRDLLGTINQRIGSVCDEVHLVVAGRVLRI